MKTVTLELPDAAVSLINNLSKSNYDKLSEFIQFWLYNLSSKPDITALDSMRNLQNKIASNNLSKKEIEDLIEESIT